MSDLETLIRRHRHLERRYEDRSGDKRPLDPTMDEFVSTQSDGQPMLIALSLERPSGTSVTKRIHNDQERLAQLVAQGWVESPDQST